MNWLPLPIPSLWALTVPPCISTRPFTRARPIPRPPAVRSMLRSTCENMSKMRGSDSRGMPMPESRTLRTASSPSHSAVSQIVPPGSVYLALLVQQVAQPPCESRVRSASSVIARFRNGDRQLVARGIDRGACGFDGVADDLGKLHAGPLEVELVLADARHVKQIVDQPNQMAELASIISRAAAAPAEFAAVSRRTCRPFRNGASGFRSSWASRAMN